MTNHENHHEGIEPNDDASSLTPEHETASDVRAESLLLERAIGGWRGIIDSGLPTMVFITAYIITGQELQPSVIAAVIAGLVIVGWRLIRRQPLQQVGAGLIGLAVSAIFTWKTGRAENFFLPGLLTNLAYGTAFLVSILVRWPLLGVAMGYLASEGTAWRREPSLRRTYAAASWLWVLLFFGRVIVQTPLYLAGWVTALGIVKIVMGWPLFLAAAYFTYRVLAPILEARRSTRASEVPEQPL
ncbi:MAG: DUF3159 domain-containing protein [Candidatus Nanopelagicales bacterium]